MKDFFNSFSWHILLAFGIQILLYARKPSVEIDWKQSDELVFSSNWEQTQENNHEKRPDLKSKSEACRE